MNKQINELLETINTATAEIARINNEDKPKEQTKADKSEPVRLWCAKDYLNLYNRNDILTLCNRYMNYPLDDFQSGFYDNFDDFKRRNPHASETIYPLVKRPAKEGEWFVVTNPNNLEFPYHKTGDVLQALGNQMNESYNHVYYKKNGEYHVAYNADYEVIENYHGEYETCPTCGKMGGK